MASSSLSQPSPLELAKAYHAIIKEEFNAIRGNRGAQSTVVEVSHRIAQICHDESQLISIVSARLGVSQARAKTIVRDLIDKGFLLNIAYDDTLCTNPGCCTPAGHCYRSFHMDMALRSTDIRYYPGAAPMVASSKLAVVEQAFASPEDRCILPSGRTTCQDKAAQKLALDLNKTLTSFIGDKHYAEALIEALEEYLKTRAGGRPPYGYDHYQAAAIVEALSRAQQGDSAAVVVAPTGSGKTEIFTAITLAILLRNKAQGREGKALFIYPRKMLEIDQANRFLELMKILASALKKRKLKPLTFGIRDGDAHEIEEKLALNTKGRVLLRGLACSNGKLYAERYNGGIKLKCCDNKGNCVNDPQAEEVFKITKKEIKDADIVITNVWTLGFRMLSIAKDDLNICDLQKTAVIVLDEAHEYDSVQLGDLSHMIRELTLLRKSNGLDELYVVVSTATLRDPLRFTEKLTNRNGKVTDLTFDGLRKKHGLSLRGERLFLTLFVQLLPTTGWNTYISEWAAVTLYTWLAAKEKGLAPQQSIVFINNVRELNRTARSIFQETLSLGSPLDNLCRRKKTCESPLKALDTFKHICCLEENLCDKAANQGPQELLANRYDIVFSHVPQEERAKIYETFHRQELGMLFATSSLELGMDYPNVSIILNAGLDRPDSLVQRIGRGGRSLNQTLNTVLAIILIRNNPLDYRFYADLNRVTQIALRQANLLPLKKISDKLTSIQALSLLRYAVAKELLTFCGTKRCSKSNTLNELTRAIQRVTDQELKELDIDSEIKDQLLVELQTHREIIQSILDLADILRNSPLEIVIGKVLSILNDNIIDELEQLIESDELNDKDKKILIKIKTELENILVKPLGNALEGLYKTVRELEDTILAFKMPTEEQLYKLCRYITKIKLFFNKLDEIAKDTIREARNYLLKAEESIGNKEIVYELETEVDERLTDLRRLINEEKQVSIKLSIKPILDKLNNICNNGNIGKAGGD